ncbi:MAG: biopolymer transporter ExbD [Proteobacteria bacterium]|nr:biopolymer transporter ExbD [Pseudomonadota bacterium]MBU2226925.1 biopolymer transporter ExbD [Pseudomonadota bacterium]
MEDKEFDYINVIPLVDVMLVLLTIVLTTSTFIATGMISLSLPKASHGQAESVRWQTISIDQTGRIYFNTAEVALEGLSAALDRLDRETPLVVRADCNIRLQVFIDVLDLLNGRGFKKVTVQTEKRGDPGGAGSRDR